MVGRALGRIQFVARVHVAELERAAAGQPALYLDRQPLQHLGRQRAVRLDVFRLRHLGHLVLVLGTGFGLLERSRAEEDHLAVLDRGDPAHREAAAITGAVHVIDDGVVDVAGAQEIGVQRMHVATVVDRGLCRRQRLAQHLAAKHVLGADVAALPAEQVVLQPLQREQVDQLGDDGFGRVVQGGRPQQ